MDGCNVVILLTADNSFCFFKAKEIELYKAGKPFSLRAVIVFLKSDCKRMPVCR